MHVRYICQIYLCIAVFILNIFLKLCVCIDTKLWSAISGNYPSPAVSLKRLSNYFANPNDKVTVGGESKSVERVPIVCILDEMDFLINSGNNNVAYNFLNWPMLVNSNLIIIGIANSMDLPERLNTS
jgi:origin recognition complex subunit 1